MTAPPSASAHLLGRGSIYTIARAAQLLAALVVTPLVTRQLSAGEFGVVATATRVGQVLAVLVAVGLPAALARIYFEGGGVDRSRRLGVSTLLISLSLALVAHLTGPWWSDLFNGLDYSGPLIAVVWGAVAMSVLEAAQGLQRARDDATGFVVAAIIASAFGQLGGLAVVIVWDAGPTGYLAAVAFANAVAAVFAAARVGMIGARPAAVVDVRAAVRLGGPTVPHLLALLVIATGDRVVVERILGLGDVARYEVSYQLGSLALLLLTSVNNAWAPMIYGADPEERWQVLAETTDAVLRIMVPLIAAVALAGPVGLRVLAPASYDLDGLAPVVAVLAGSSVLYVRYLANVHVVFQERRTTVLLWAAPVAATVNIGLCAVFVRWWGLIGAALATAAAFVILGSLMAMASSRIVTVPWHRRSSLIGHLLVVVIVLAACALPASGPVWLTVRGAAGAAAVVLAAREVRAALRRPA